MKKRYQFFAFNHSGVAHTVDNSKHNATSLTFFIILT